MKYRLGLVLVCAIAGLMLTSFIDTPTRVVSLPVLPTETPTSGLLGTVPSTHTPTVALTVTMTRPISFTPPPAGPTGKASTPPATATQATVALATPSSGSQATMKLDMNVIFPPGEGRDFVLDNCLSSCHNWVPLMQQKTKESWAILCKDHSIRHGVRLEMADYAALCTYLQTHFNPDKPLPKLPDWFNEGVLHPWGTFVGY